jgi:hypothetical protein
VLGKLRLEDRFQNVPQRTLHDAVAHRRDTPSKLHFSAIGLWDGRPSPIRFTLYQASGFWS